MCYVTLKAFKYVKGLWYKHICGWDVMTCDDVVVLILGFVSSLHVAAARGLADCLSVILSHGADLSITDAAGTFCSCIQ